MTDTKAPVRRTARTQPAKTSTTAARSAATSATAKPAGAGKKAAVAKSVPAKAAATTKKPVVKPASKAPAKAVAATSLPVANVKAAPVVPVAAAAPAAQVKARSMPKGDSYKLRMLVDQVIKATGAKKKGVKDVVEAALSRIGEALARGDELNLPGFGKVRVVKSDAKDGTAIMTLKLRQGTSKSGQKTLADSGDDD